MSGPGWFRRKPTKKRGLVLTGTSAALVLAAGVVFATVASPGSHASLVASEGPAHATKPLAPAASLQLISMTPAAGSKNVNGASPIRVQFSSPLAPDSPMPTLSPSIPGTWAVQGNAAVFTPKVGYFENTKVTVKIPGGLAGLVSAAGATAGNGGTLGSNVTKSFTTRSFSTMRLQQLMTQLGYLPMTWKPTSAAVISPADARAQLSAAYSAPGGTFSWKGSWPWTLRSQWKAGKYNILNVGAVRAFESVNGMTMDGSAGKAVWTKLFKQLAKGQQNPNGYTYALANQHYPINLTIWHNGKEVLHSLANTGIPASSTVDGTFPVYLKYVFSHMKGTNPDGSKYDDPVWYASYFNGGDAVHQFDRYSYGSYQSLGCV
ncbi:MAG TPA: Ig-like domain-containing protein, partial [Streptosporangiaceae bacterium]